VRLTYDPAEDYWPAWSPDGTQIAFHSDRDVSLSLEIYVMNADGSDPVRLTNNLETISKRSGSQSLQSTEP
jgi:TolB protein